MVYIGYLACYILGGLCGVCITALCISGRHDDFK